MPLSFDEKRLFVGAEDMKNQLICALYVRTTLREPDPEPKLRTLREFAQKKGWAVQGEHVDREINQPSDVRPQLEALLRRVRRKRQLGAMVVWSFANYSRSMFHFLETVQQITGPHRTHFVSYEDNFDSSTHEGQIFLRAVTQIDELQKNLALEKAYFMLRKGMGDGRGPGRYRISTDLEKLIRLAEEGKTVRQIAKEVGMTSTTVSRRLSPVRARYAGRFKKSPREKVSDGTLTAKGEKKHFLEGQCQLKT